MVFRLLPNSLYLDDIVAWGDYPSNPEPYILSKQYKGGEWIY